MKKRVAVLMGGRSAEREISLLTGEQIYQALLEKNYDAVKIQMDEGIVENLKKEKPDVVFIALHGRFGEDGTIQGLLEILEIPYTGSGVAASAIAINKAITKQMFRATDINTPPFLILEKAQDLVVDNKRIIEEIGIPLVVKPACEGSTIGISIVKSKQELAGAIELAFFHDSKIIVEKFIEGTEITVGILGNDPIALPTLEIVTETDFYDYDTKYTAGLSTHIIPARIPADQQEKAQKLAVDAHKAIGCSGYSRVDIIVDKKGISYVLEINTIPGMTKLSLYPDTARAAGYEFHDLVEEIVKLALEK